MTAELRSIYSGPIRRALEGMQKAVDAKAPLISTTPWTTIFGAAGWTNYGSGWANAAYRKVGDEVQVRGLVTNPNSVSGSVALATLPAGFCPPYNMMFPAHLNLNNTTYQVGRIDISPAGIMAYQATATGVVAYLSLDAIRFSITP